MRSRHSVSMGFSYGVCAGRKTRSNMPFESASYLSVAPERWHAALSITAATLPTFSIRLPMNFWTVLELTDATIAMWNRPFPSAPTRFTDFFA